MADYKDWTEYQALESIAAQLMRRLPDPDAVQAQLWVQSRLNELSEG